jgi:hypothetical protein
METKKKVIYSADDFELSSSEPVHNTVSVKKTKEGFEVRYLLNDDCPDSPREWDNLGKMLCFHNRYTLGDKHEGLNSEDKNSWEEWKEYLTKELHAVIILPLYLYDHSGLSLKTFRHGQHAGWDCGQVGFAYITKEQLKKEGLTKKKAEAVLTAEIETYDQYIQGDVYCLAKDTFDKDKKHLDHDKVSGYYGYDEALKALETEI